MKAKYVAFGLAFVAAGCSVPPRQEVNPAGRIVSKQVCVVENPAVKQPEFIEAYMRAIASRGLTVRRLPANSPTTACPVVSTYVAYWQWDVRSYLAYAEFRVYNNGAQVGSASYDARRTATFNKFINADAKVNELTSQLFAGS